MKYFLILILILFYSCSHKIKPYVYYAKFPENTDTNYIRKITGISKPISITDSGYYFTISKHTRFDKKLEKLEIKEKKKRIKKETKFIAEQRSIRIEQQKDSSKIVLNDFKERLKEKDRISLKEIFKIFVSIVLLIVLIFVTRLLRKKV